ncbi:hypothetical protein [Campylobacter pinnipediorum]|uniref:Uncharacterized protein n=1 Tax=Campylobacter pinnipediorum subsp. pinnipediorum TaxID=1660067 RepID=A0AAX0L8Y0_9BACT|nr:hypothetical protein [Campylobacter pinnipediorum]AQW81949.1 hypothetical protein CPIN17260_1680 [Campylobacter pinnipediorum subsp. pinnipediorum]AQW83619.1 hypothetical protein CPIN17261_1633 [Campylobacter pinnipediorum subsp. pinnipediorum]AQW85141.1 hypothetical protein CPIN17262_1479 [Campylobacter pinnipediorum subsp. pinnipediorum]OPA75889.1 hypothetical protein BFG04_05450 [Campylobacter pinnipediorum subsp. pinnipediorum]OPA76000.1 hypothetical protein BFG05_05555 [Campylobacter p
MKFGYLSDIGEITPDIFSNLDSVSRLKTFIKLYNSCVEQELKLPLHYSKYKNIKNAFKHRIQDLLEFDSNLKKTKVKTFCAVSNLIIFYYKNKQFDNIKYITKQPKNKAAKMIKMLYINSHFELCFDANFMFSQFVYDRIAYKNFDKDVSFQNDSICICKDSKKLLCVLTSFKNFSLDDTSSLSNEISSAVKAIKEYGFDRVYVVMPRNDNFRKHIEVRHCECDFNQIKLVPYAIDNKKTKKGI